MPSEMNYTSSHFSVDLLSYCGFLIVLEVDFIYLLLYIYIFFLITLLLDYGIVNLLVFVSCQPQPQPQTPSKHHLQPLLHQPQYHPVHHNHQAMHQNQHAAQYSQSHQCAPTSHLPEIGHAHHSPTMSQHIACLQPLTSGHVGGRLHVLVRLLLIGLIFLPTLIARKLVLSYFNIPAIVHAES